MSKNTVIQIVKRGEVCKLAISNKKANEIRERTRPRN